MIDFDPNNRSPNYSHTGMHSETVHEVYNQRNKSNLRDDRDNEETDTANVTLTS